MEVLKGHSVKPYPCIAEFGLVLHHLLVPEVLHICKATPADHAECDQENVCLLIGQDSYPIKIPLAGCVPKTRKKY